MLWHHLLFCMCKQARTRFNRTGAFYNFDGTHVCRGKGATPIYTLATEYSPDCVLVWQMAVYGNFSGHKAQEVMVSRGSVLELLRPDEAGHMQVLRLAGSKPLVIRAQCAAAHAVRLHGKWLAVKTWSVP